MAKQNTIFGLNTTELLVGGGAIALAYFGVVKPLLNKLGITKSNDDRLNENAALVEDAWKSNFWKTAPAGSLLLTKASATGLVNKIFNYPGVFNDDYAAVKAAIFSLKTKSQVSFLADQFNIQKGKNLYEYLRVGKDWTLDPAGGLSATHLAELNKYVQALPKYKV